MQLELITRQPDRPHYLIPLLFVHGVWHSAWCWDEFFLPYFAAHGFVAHALSFRNHGQSARVGNLHWQRGAEYVADVAEVVQQLGQPPVLIGHSFGGYAVQKYLEQHTVPAAVLLAPVPARGGLAATLRFARRHPWAFLQTNLQRRLWPIVGSPDLAHDGLFAKTMPRAQVNAYFRRLQDDSYRAFLDLVILDLPRPKRVRRVPMLVLNGAADQIFTPAEARATARIYGAAVEIFPQMPHDLMLDPRWQRVADRIIAWLKSVPGLC